jgi:hypothetical protein
MSKKRFGVGAVVFASAVSTLLGMSPAGAANVHRGEFCSKAKLGTHSGSFVCKKVGKYNRWE